MRILHFIDTLGAGGAERQLVYLLQNLDHKRYECHVLTTYDRLRHFEADLSALGIPIYSLHHGELRIVKRAEAFARYIRLMWKLRPQIVHGWLHYPNLIARTARPFCPPHHLITAVRSQYTANELRSERLTAWLSELRIVISESRDREKQNSHTNTIMIPNGIDLGRFGENPLPNLRNSLFPNTKFLILVPARIDPRKDHLTLIEALHKFAPPEGVKVVLIGEVTDANTQQQIQEAIQYYQLDSTIQQLPPTHDIVPFYQAADLVLLTSKSEAFANIILEALAAHKPMIVSEAANNQGLIQHGVNGWVFPTSDSTALTECLKAAIACSDDDRAAMGQHGYDLIQSYTVSAMVERYAQLYERAISKES